MGVLALALLAAHPVFLAFGGSGLGLLLSIDQPWYILIAKASLGLGIMLIAASILRRRLNIDFRLWRLAHGPAALLVVGSGLAHSWVVGDDLANMPMQALWLGFGTLFLGALVWHRCVVPELLARAPWHVAEVRNEARDVTTLVLAPPAGQEVFSYQPGQFAFVTLQRGQDLPVEEHHFTLSSSPTEKGHLAMSIKAVGDFTASIPQTKPGDAALIQGPFGRFSCALDFQGGDLVFIAGGIGITPLRAMLRYLADTEPERSVLLVHACRTEQDLAFRAEFEAMAEAGKPQLIYVPVLSRPGSDWGGETGHVDAALLTRLVGSGTDGKPVVTSKSFYLCGPEALTMQLETALLGWGVPEARLHRELFQLVD
jgi:predicted ferric reductase